MQEQGYFQNAIFTLLQGEFSSCHKQLFFLYSRTFSNVRANQTQHDRSLGGKKTQLRGQRRADLSCIFMWLEGSVTAVSENCEQWQKKVCVVRDSWGGKSMLLTPFSPTPCPNVNVTGPQWAKLCVPISDSQNPNFNSLFHPPLSLRQQIWTEKFSLRSGAQQNGKQTEPSLHWPEPTSAF